jgi:feruloyl esterase
MKKYILSVFLLWFISINAFTQQLRLNLPGVSLSIVEDVPGGTFTPPGSSQAIEHLPAFVRVAAVAKPAPGSNIRIEVWLPEDWNGRFLAMGNGGGAGNIPYGSLADD